MLNRRDLQYVTKYSASTWCFSSPGTKLLYRDLDGEVLFSDQHTWVGAPLWP